MSRRPHRAGTDVLQVAPLSVIVARGVDSPSVDGDIAVSAYTSAGVADERRIRRFAQQGEPGQRGIGRVESSGRGGCDDGPLPGNDF